MRNIIILFIFFSHYASAEIHHELIRRVVVFPLLTEAQFQEEANEVWWVIRETFTEGKRFLVASKDFLERKDVFQARGELTPADVIILGDLLDAHLLFTGIIKNKILHLYAYESARGQLVWGQSQQMHPSLTLKEQIQKVSKELTNRFIADLPYHGFVTKDELIGQYLIQKDGRYQFQIFVSPTLDVSKGDEVQLIKLYSQNLKPLFQGGGQVEVFAVGKVMEVNNGFVWAELIRATNLEEIKESTLVRFPNELRRVKELYTIKDSIKRRISPDYFSPEMTDLHSDVNETKPLVTALAFLINIASILLIAF